MWGGANGQPGCRIRSDRDFTQSETGGSGALGSGSRLLVRSLGRAEAGGNALGRSAALTLRPAEPCFPFVLSYQENRY